MSGIVGSRLNIRGSGLVGNIGTDGQVLTSSGAGQELVFEDAGGAVTALNNATENELVSVGSTTTELDAEPNLTFSSNTLFVKGNDGDHTVHVQGGGSDSAYLLMDAHSGGTNTSNWLFEAKTVQPLQVGTDLRNPCITITWNGNAENDNVWSDNAFDYAELFEWDTHLSNDDDVKSLWGLSVVFNGDKVKIAQAGEEADIIGVVRPIDSTAIHGDGLHWRGMFLRDVWGGFEKESYTKETWDDQSDPKFLHSYHSDEIPAYRFKNTKRSRNLNHHLKEENFELDENGNKIPVVVPSTAEEKVATNYTEYTTETQHPDNPPLKRRKYNPSYDETIPYIKRKNRPKEWVLIGLLGQVPVKDTAIISTHWKLMKNLESGLDKYLIFNK